MSFKLKLVAYFLLVSLLPLAAAAWGLHAVAWRSETRGVDVRLEAGLRAVLAAYKDDLSAAGQRARAIAAEPRFQRALAEHDRATLRRLLAGAPHLRLESKGLSLGPAAMIGPSASVSVTGASGVLGTLVAGVPLTPQALTGLHHLSGRARGRSGTVATAPSQRARSGDGSAPTWHFSPRSPRSTMPSPQRTSGSSAACSARSS
jgi:hypothetical protein